MPKLGKYSPILNCVFRLFLSKEAAENGVNPQGSGFLVAVPYPEAPGYVHVHGVTNWHVAVDGPPASHIQIKIRDGRSQVFDLDPSEWFYKPDSYDIAISPPLVLRPGFEEVAFLDVDSFLLTSEQEVNDEVDSCDDVFMVGLFLDEFKNVVHFPSFRFGHISNPKVTVVQPTGYMGRSIMLDMNSRTGFSGSPVFVYRTLGSHFIENSKPGQVLTGGGHYMKLLGIHWGQVKEVWSIKKVEKLLPTSERRPNVLEAEDEFILGLSGMTYVVPAACIREVLELPELIGSRMRDNSVCPPYSQSSSTSPTSMQPPHAASQAPSVP